MNHYLFFLKRASCFFLFFFFTVAHAMDDEGPGRWNKEGIPHKGWTYVAVRDLKDVSGMCGMCDKKDLRYLHEVSHPESDTLFVGAVCANHMTKDYKKPQKEQQKAVQKASAEKKKKEKEEQAREAKRRRLEKERERVAKEEEKKELSWQTLSAPFWNQKPNGNYVAKLADGWITLFKGRYNNWGICYKKQKFPWFPTPLKAAEASYKELFKPQALGR